MFNLDEKRLSKVKKLIILCSLATLNSNLHAGNSYNNVYQIKTKEGLTRITNIPPSAFSDDRLEKVTHYPDVPEVDPETFQKSWNENLEKIEHIKQIPHTKIQSSYATATAYIYDENDLKEFEKKKKK